MENVEEWAVLAIMAVPMAIVALVAVLKSYRIHIHIKPPRKGRK